MRPKYNMYLHDKQRRTPQLPCAPKFLPCFNTFLLPQEERQHLCERHALLDLSDREGRVKTLGAGTAAVQNGVAAVQAHAVVERVLALLSALVTRVGDPAVRLHQHGRAQVLLAVPPVRRARGAAASAQDALVQTVELAAVGLRLEVLLALLVLIVSMCLWVAMVSGLILTSAGAWSRWRYGLIDLYCL